MQRVENFPLSKVIFFSSAERVFCEETVLSRSLTTLSWCQLKIRKKLFDKKHFVLYPGSANTCNQDMVIDCTAY